MELKDIKELIALMKKNDLSVFKMEKEGFKITLKKESDQPPTVAYQPVEIPASRVVAAAAPEAASPAASPAPEKSDYREITSPMVGTFYSAPSPESPVFVEVGQQVTADTVVCIIEAMKVMNEIKAETSGTIVEILVENGKPVQFGQALYKIK
jgi:acetyl-CoA carboxylase biotin carboxyl carrier protein